MEKVASHRADKVDARSVAASLQDDFAELVRIFDRELAVGRSEASGRSHIADAKDAAERGLRLSKQLAGLLSRGD